MSQQQTASDNTPRRNEVKEVPIRSSGDEYFIPQDAETDTWQWPWRRNKAPYSIGTWHDQSNMG